MKQILLSSAFLLLGLNLFAQSKPSACAAAPWPITVSQPDGSTLEIIGEGNNWISWSRTTDHYTVLQDAYGNWVYATRNAAGEMIPGTLLAHNPDNRTLGEQAFLSQKLEKEIHYSTTQEQQLLSQVEAAPALHKKNNAFPTSGKRKVLVILIQFPDLAATHADSAFWNMMNQPNYKGTGSFRDFYLENSEGQFDLDIDVVGWYTAQNNYANYGRNNGNSAAAPLIAEAIDAAEADGVDFSEYDNDGDGELDGLLVVHSGPGAEEGSNLQYIWSHRWVLFGSNYRYYDNTAIADYCINPETRNYGKVNIGVYNHEFGHILGLPDLYDTQASSGDGNGIGEWGLMGSCSWLNQEKTPCHMEGWSKYQMGWINPTVISNNGQYTLDTFATKHQVYRINTANPQQYFLLENRQKVKFDIALKGHGLAIFHIDELKTNLYPGSNTVNDDTARLGVGLEEADGLWNLKKKVNRGDQGDLFPGTANKTSFGPGTNPSSRLNGGLPSNILISQIQETGGIISFRIGASPAAGFVTSGQSGCAPYKVQFTDGSNFASSVSWHFGDSSAIDSIRSPLHTFSKAGTYKVWQIVYDSLGNRADSSWKNIYVDPSPDADFNYTSTGFDFTFNGTSTGASGHAWDFDGTGLFNIYGNPVNYTFPGYGTYKVTVRAFNLKGCPDTLSKFIGIYGAGVQEINGNQPLIYPNPSTGTVYLLAHEALLQIRVLNLAGQEIHQQKGNAQNAELELGNLPAGMYLLELETAAGTTYHRLLLED